jgi:hypothetical protein
MIPRESLEEIQEIAQQLMLREDRESRLLAAILMGVAGGGHFGGVNLELLAKAVEQVTREALARLYSEIN